MNENSFLNYSRGMTLQSFCNRILNSQCDADTVDSWKSEIDVELAMLMRNRPVCWDRPYADICYFECLKELREILEHQPATEAVHTFLNHVKSITREKIHGLFLTEEVSCWPSMASVFEAANNSEAYHATLVYTPFTHKNLNEQRDYYTEYKNKYNLPVVAHDQYDLEADSPDVVFMIKPYSSVPKPYQPKSILSVIPRVVYIPYGMEITVDLIRFAFQHYLQMKAWRHCAYGQIVKDYATKYGYCNGKNVVVWGHPKADHCLSDKKPSNEMLRFINGRKTILWSPHHLIDLDKPGTGTWLIWGEQILEIALQNPDIAFIFRPHPMMVGALVNNGFLSKKDLEGIKKKISKSTNIYWDKNDSYVDAFHAADAIITDGTTFSVEFLYTGKPIMLTPRNMDGFYVSQDMLESYYVVKEIADVSLFIEMVRSDSDPLKEKRMMLRDKMFYLPEGKTVGQNIIDNIAEDLKSECMKGMLLL